MKTCDSCIRPEVCETSGWCHRAEDKAADRLHPTAGSGSSFEWITPKDRRWAEWCAWDEKILVMTHEGPCVVRVPENSLPWYHALDDEDIADPDEWTAWSRIPCIQNAKRTCADD